MSYELLRCSMPPGLPLAGDPVLGCAPRHNISAAACHLNCAPTCLHAAEVERCHDLRMAVVPQVQQAKAAPCPPLQRVPEVSGCSSSSSSNKCGLGRLGSQVSLEVPLHTDAPYALAFV